MSMKISEIAVAFGLSSLAISLCLTRFSTPGQNSEQSSIISRPVPAKQDDHISLPRIDALMREIDPKSRTCLVIMPECSLCSMKSLSPKDFELLVLSTSQVGPDMPSARRDGLSLTAPIVLIFRDGLESLPAGYRKLSMNFRVVCDSKGKVVPLDWYDSGPFAVVVDSHGVVETVSNKSESVIDFIRGCRDE